MDSKIQGHSKTAATIKAVCANCSTRSQCLNGKLTLDEVNSLPAHYIRRSTLKEGQLLYRKGEPLSNIYNLRFGSIKSEMIMSNGMRQVTHFSLPGELLGLDGIANGKHQVDTISIHDSEVCSISYENLKQMTKDYPVLINNIESSLGSLLNTSNVHIFDLINLNAMEKLADFLIDYANRISKAGFDRDHFVLPMDRVDLASYLGVKIETLSRSITQLEKIGAIKTSNRKIEFISRKPIFEFLDPAILREKHDSKKGAASQYPASTEKRKKP
jgi:CRP/FNR family transcriptional regulator